MAACQAVRGTEWHGMAGRRISVSCWGLVRDVGTRGVPECSLHCTRDHLRNKGSVCGYKENDASLYLCNEP
jgi:hypothetical protein